MKTLTEINNETTSPFEEFLWGVSIGLIIFCIGITVATFIVALILGFIEDPETRNPLNSAFWGMLGIAIISAIFWPVFLPALMNHKR